MAEQSFYNDIQDAFFNSVHRDRIYNANHLCDWLKSTNSNGVVPEPVGQLKVEVNDNLRVSVSTGLGMMEGHTLNLQSIQYISIEEPPSNPSYSRIDVVGMRINYSLRRCELFYRSGEIAGTPVRPTLVTDKVTYYEMALAYINVNGGSVGITQSNIEDARSFVFSTSTIFQRLEQDVNINATTSLIKLTVAYNPSIDILSVYVNGELKKEGTHYTISNDYIVFMSSLYSGTQVYIQNWHFSSVAGLEQIDLNTIETEVQEMNKYYYYCNGTNDNIVLSNLAQNFLNGTNEFAGVNANAQMELIICGDCGYTTPYSGDGTQAFPNTYFAFGRNISSTRTIYFNFSNCSMINIYCDNTTGVYSTIFSGSDINIRNVSLNVPLGYNVDMFNGQNIHCVDSEFWMSIRNNCCVGRCCGFFENVRTSVSSSEGNAYGFYGNGRLLRVIGGTHYAWTGSAGSGKEAVCFYVEAYQTTNVLFIQMANMPQYTRSGYTQTDTIKVNHGYATIMMNTMWKIAAVYDTTTCLRYGNVITSII